MVSRPLLKTSPLSGVYRHYPTQLETTAGWQIALHFGNPEGEHQALETGTVLVDWSHLGKVSLSGREAAQWVEGLVPGAASIAPQNSLKAAGMVALRLTANDYLVLCPPAEVANSLTALAAAPVAVLDQSGALGCVVLAGPRRDEVLERSTAVNLSRHQVPPGAVIQSTIHTIRCTLYRTPTLEVILHPRSLSESLFNALMDVGVGVGLVPGGIVTVPLSGLSC